MEHARRLAAGPRVAYTYMKENLNRAVNGGSASAWTSRRPTTFTAG